VDVGVAISLGTVGSCRLRKPLGLFRTWLTVPLLFIRHCTVHASVSLVDRTGAAACGLQ